ncbi:MAG: aryl-sulfate sulfotransferase [Myxococcota bacterium]
MRALATLALAACTASAPAPIVLPDPGTCALDPDNALRARCLGAGPLSVGVVPADGSEPSATFESDGDEVVLWDLRGDTDYAYELHDARGTRLATFTTGTPSTAPQLEEELALGPTRLTDLDRVLFPLTCTDGTALYAIDGAGRLRWYQPLPDTPAVSGLALTDRGTIAVTASRSVIRELGFDGSVVLTAKRGTELDRYVHHGLVGPDERILALDDHAVPYDDGLTYLVDGVTEIADGVATHVWDIAEILDPRGLPTGDPVYWSLQAPGAVDFGHENGIDVADDGDWLLTFKQLDLLLRLDPDHEPRWVLSGGDTPEGGLPPGVPALALTSSAGLDPTFQHPHHPLAAPDGTLLLLDNGDRGAESRVLQLRIDDEEGTADVVGAWPLGDACPVQSSAFPLSDGTLLAACTQTSRLSELRPGGVVHRRLQVTCADGTVPRGMVGAVPFTRP